MGAAIDIALPVLITADTDFRTIVALTVAAGAIAGLLR
jgi:hypothetical protein